MLLIYDMWVLKLVQWIAASLEVLGFVRENTGVVGIGAELPECRGAG